MNDKLKALDVQFIEKLDDGKKNFDAVGEGDVVILPAFGASYEEMDYFDKKVSPPVLMHGVFPLLDRDTNPLTPLICNRTSRWSIRLVPGSPRFGTRWISTRNRV